MIKFIEGLNWVAILGIAIAIETQISNGTMSIAHSFPVVWQPIIKEWAGNLAGIGGLMVTMGSFGQRPAGQFTITPTVVKVLIAAFALSTFLAIPSAQAQVRKPLTGNIVNDLAAATAPRIGGGLTGAPVTDLQNALNVKLLPDLQYALKLAQASGSKVTAPCYQAWIDIITTQQTAVKNQDGTDLAMPDPHVITEFEKLIELRNALTPESDFMIKCSPVASMVKKDITGFMGIVISGGAGLATLVPGL